MNQLNDTLARKILDSSADAFVAMDTRGYITEWNKAAEKMFGWTRTEAIGRTVAETIIPMRYREGHEQGIQHFRATGIAASRTGHSKYRPNAVMVTNFLLSLLAGRSSKRARCNSTVL